MTAAGRLLVFRAIGFTVAAVLAVAATFGVTAELTRPAFRAADLYAEGARLPVGFNRTAGTVSLDGDIRADLAARDAMAALTAAPSVDRAELNKAAQADVSAVLATSPANALMWTTLGLLRAQAGEPSGPALKASYLTGAVPQDALARRITTVVTSSAVDDEDIRLLAQADIRSILTRYPRLEPTLIGAYRRAGPSGRNFLIDAAQMVDPRFSRLLKANS